MTARLPATAGCIVSLLVLATSASAQEPPPEGVRSVTIHRESGDEIRGHLLQLGPELLTLLVDGQHLDMPLTSVTRIDAGRDSIRNGALIGALIGGGFCAFVCGQGVDTPAGVPIAAAINAVFWGAVGAAIDATIPGRTTIYRRAPASSAPRAALAYQVRF